MSACFLSRENDPVISGKQINLLSQENGGTKMYECMAF